MEITFEEFIRAHRDMSKIEAFIERVRNDPTSAYVPNQDEQEFMKSFQPLDDQQIRSYHWVCQRARLRGRYLSHTWGSAERAVALRQYTHGNWSREINAFQRRVSQSLEEQADEMASFLERMVITSKNHATPIFFLVFLTQIKRFAEEIQ